MLKKTFLALIIIIGLNFLRGNSRIHYIEAGQHRNRDDHRILSDGINTTPQFKFPADHGPHNNFRTEWWYFTGNLSAPDGRKFGYEFTVFRNASTFNSIKRKSDFEKDQVYMAHFAVSDIKNQKFYYKEKIASGESDDAGVSSEPFKIKVIDWTVDGNYPDKNYYRPNFQINASTQNYSISLILQSDKPLVLQGDNGISRKGTGKDEYSNYYSITRLTTGGTITIGKTQYKVTGSSWFDREWTNSTVTRNDIGWDWFALQLKNDTEIMYYNIRHRAGVANLYDYGVIIDNRGKTEKLSSRDVKLAVTGYWRNQLSKLYPSGWILSIPKKNISLKIEPLMKDQELKLFVNYWEGAVSVKGQIRNKEINGKGYVELTGY